MQVFLLDDWADAKWKRVSVAVVNNLPLSRKAAQIEIMALNAAVRCAFCATPLQMRGLSLVELPSAGEIADGGELDGFVYTSREQLDLTALDPRVVTRNSIDWLRTRRILGYNSDTRR
ncbi:hypothetical protein jhhlp_007457 [Lomentospora prolificans]|uniref:Uncharacterized protein n=1 Tax=Lomentospora prolificans TaxID=41688 RepID=A0A2N3N131_9PEZI|nr:hypothetical protein jhhlp_007457 [Lomentospora prolificans]